MTTKVDHSSAITRPAEQLVQPGERIAFGRLVHVCEDLLRGRDVGVADDPLLYSP
ncbi:MAG: hypothetical protein M3Z75_00825 [Actinomycetota bacterium]|nr:hypothetical protein [Actinomycetota bacterium]